MRVLPKRSLTEARAQIIADWADGPITALGIVFLLLVLIETVSAPQGTTALIIQIASWALWLIFALEFLVRLIAAESTTRFLRKNWWQIVFLVLPFFRFIRALSRIRALRAGRMISSATRSSRSTKALLGGRIGWLSVVTLIVALSASQILYELSSFETYTDALHAAALATITGEPLGRPGVTAALLDVVLSIYSVVVFATLAGMTGAYFVEGRDANREDGARQVS